MDMDMDVRTRVREEEAGVLDMLTRSTIAKILSTVVLGVLLLGGVARADDTHDHGAALYAQGEALLKQGQIDEAAQAFLAAARAAPKNQVYVQRALVLRKVQGLRRYVASKPFSERWASSAKSLHLFYVQNDIPSLAVGLDTVAHERMKNATSAGWLAEAYLEAGQNVEATNLLATYSGQSPHLAAYHAIALARLGSVDAAKRVGATAVVTEGAEPAYLFDVARLQALLGNGPQALSLLRTSFERTPTAALPVVKARAQGHADLAAVRTLPAYAEVLRTASQVKQTCSGGSSCGSCPNRGSCGGGK